MGSTRMKWLRVPAVLAVLIALFIVLGSLPIMETRIAGIENFQPADSSLSLSAHLFPSDDFPQRFSHTWGDYQYYYNGKLEPTYQTSFAVLQYTPETYQAAKAYCQEQFTLTDEHRYQLGSFTFIEHLWLTSENEDGEWLPGCRFPKYFNMYAYSDETNTLLFLGFYDGRIEEGNTGPQTSADFEALYNEHFSKYYSLDG